MKRLTIKSKGCMWPTVMWQNSQLVIFYLGEYEDDVEVKEICELDFEKIFLQLDRGGSVFITTNPNLKSSYSEGPMESAATSDLLRDYV